MIKHNLDDKNNNSFHLAKNGYDRLKVEIPIVLGVYHMTAFSHVQMPYDNFAIGRGGGCPYTGGLEMKRVKKRLKTHSQIGSFLLAAHHSQSSPAKMGDYLPFNDQYKYW